MSEELNEKIEAAIAKMADQVKAQPDSQRCVHLSQSALNLAHAKAVLLGSKEVNTGRKSG